MSDECSSCSSGDVDWIVKTRELATSTTSWGGLPPEPVCDDCYVGIESRAYKNDKFEFIVVEELR